MNETPGSGSGDVPGDHPVGELTPVQAEWERQLGELLDQWGRTVTPAQQAELLEQIERAIDEQDLVKLAALTVGTAAADLLAAAMALLAVSASTAVVTYAASAGLIVGAVTWRDEQKERMAGVAEAVAELLGRAYAGLAGNEALRRAAPGKPGREVADEVGTYLTTLKTGTLRAQLGGALTQAQQLGREAAMRQAEQDLAEDEAVRYFATEVLDSGTCVNCRAIDGAELPTLDAAMLAYGGGPYLSCLGLWRCRGTFVARWYDAAGEVRTSARPREDQDHPVQFKIEKTVSNDWRAQPRDDKGRWTDYGASALHEVADAVKALGPIGEGDHWSRLNGGQGEQGVWLATLPDGRKIVAKTHPSWADPDDTRMYVQADVLASKLQSRLGVPAATVVADRDDGTTAWIEFVPGGVIGDGHDEAGFKASADGARMGLADALSLNTDRNPGNIVVTPEDVHVGIDQSFAWGWYDTLDRIGTAPGMIPAEGEHAPIGRFLTRGGWQDNPMTRADIGKAREVLDAMAGDFAAAGHESWHAGALAMLGQLEEHATGTEDLL